MKKILITLLLVATLAVSAMAFNAPLTAAEFVSKASPEYTYTNGLLGIDFVEKSILRQYSDASGNVYTAKLAFEPSVMQNVAKVDKAFAIPSDAFDVKALFRYPAEFVAGYELRLFFNPEVVELVPLEDQTYETIYVNGDTVQTLVAASGYDVMIDGVQYETNAAYAEYLRATTSTEKQKQLDFYNNSSKDGMTTAVAAQASNLNSVFGVEIARWTFTETDSTNNNWYRTKLNLDFTKVDDANKNDLYPQIEAPVYYYNPDYTGPKFDIIGGMKKADGALRFGSVYFLGDEYFDNDAEILEAGVVCYPSELLEDKVLTLETEGALKIPATGHQTLNDKEMTYTGVITGLPEDMYITAKSYITYKDKTTGETVTAYSDPIARKLATADAVSMK
ncbi:MAG: hypothetical protein E7588_04700 [Ruminococcaceae bacterium]|nr:hypothetical protein [Oscillospiraceae bacterium]